MRIPVLCYHRIEAPPSGAETDLNFVTPNRFAEHMDMLAASGCTGVTIGDIARWQRGEIALPARSVALTFDDAYASVATHALPVLQQHGWPLTVYVVSSQVGGTNAWDVGAPRASLLDAHALRSLIAKGHEVGSHSRHHVRIRGLDDQTATDELRGSRQDLEALLGAQVDSFALPYGSHDARTGRQLHAAGYRTACTLKRWANGRHGNPLRLGRMSVGGSLATWLLQLKLLKLMLTPARR